MSLLDRLKYRWACWWLHSPRVDRVRRWAERTVREEWDRCPCGCDVPMSDDRYPALHGDTTA